MASVHGACHRRTSVKAFFEPFGGFDGQLKNPSSLPSCRLELFENLCYWRECMLYRLHVNFFSGWNGLSFLRETRSITGRSLLPVSKPISVITCLWQQLPDWAKCLSQANQGANFHFHFPGASYAKHLEKWYYKIYSNECHLQKHLQIIWFSMAEN